MSYVHTRLLAPTSFVIVWEDVDVSHFLERESKIRLDGSFRKMFGKLINAPRKTGGFCFVGHLLTEDANDAAIKNALMERPATSLAGVIAVVKTQLKQGGGVLGKENLFYLLDDQKEPVVLLIARLGSELVLFGESFGGMRHECTRVFSLGSIF